MKTVMLDVRPPSEAVTDFTNAWKTGKASGTDRISFVSPELLWKVLTAKRWELLRALCGAGPVTVREAARRVGRDVKAVHTDPTALLAAGVLNRTAVGRIEFPYEEVKVSSCCRRREGLGARACVGFCASRAVRRPGRPGRATPPLMPAPRSFTSRVSYMLRGCALVLGLLLPVLVAQAQRLPAEFVDGRVFVVAADRDGTRLRLFTDTGGGWNAVRSSVAQRLGLEPAGSVQQDDGTRLPAVGFPRGWIDQGIAAPLHDHWLQGRLVVVPDPEIDDDAFLGSRWFAGRVWSIDYLNRELRLIDRVAAPAGFASTAMTFRADLHFPRIEVEIDGERIGVLLDTGATATLSASAAPAFGVPAGSSIATSFIVREVFERWARRHPQWRVLRAADQIGGVGDGFDMIEVPQVVIAGLRVGPVWFTQRPDRAFREWMSSMTDRPIEGALGGSAFKTTRMILDYPGGRAYFSTAPR